MRLCSFIPNRDCCKSRLYTDQGASLPSGYKESARPRRRTLLYRVYSLSKFVIIWADIFIASILHAKALRDYAELHKAQPLIKMPRMDVRSNDCIKLQNSKSMCRALRQAIPHQLFPNVQGRAHLGKRHSWHCRYDRIGLHCWGAKCTGHKSFPYQHPPQQHYKSDSQKMFFQYPQQAILPARKRFHFPQLHSRSESFAAGLFRVFADDYLHGSIAFFQWIQFFSLSIDLFDKFINIHHASISHQGCRKSPNASSLPL